MIHKAMEAYQWSSFMIGMGMRHRDHMKYWGVIEGTSKNCGTIIDF
jgi:hypothetical protein